MKNILILFALLYCSILQKPAFAYVDPGSGGYLFQLLFIAFSAVLGMLAAGKKTVFKILLSPARAIKILYDKLTNRPG